MLINIVFSFNRAMQLDCFLQSFIKHFKKIDYQIAVVYHTTGEHSIAYKILRNKYQDNKKVEFFERSSINNVVYFSRIIRLLIYPKNFYRFIKYKFLRKDVDNFKFLMEKIISTSPAKYIMFSTDDTV